MRWPQDAQRRLTAAAGIIICGLVLLGIVQGIVWALVAPGQQAKVYPDGGYGPLPTSDYHPFVDLAIFVLSGLAIGLVAAVATWRVRAIRGSVTLLALFVGASTGAAAGYVTGLLLASGVDASTVGATGAASIVIEAPKLATPLVMLAEPLAAMVVYTFLVAWDGRPDLGRLRATERPDQITTPTSEPSP